MTIYQIFIETFEEICILLGFFTLVLMLCIAIRMFCVYLHRRYKKALKKAQLEIQQEEAQKSAELRQRDLIAYYDLLSEDAAQSSKPNKYIVNLYNFNID